MDGRVQQPVIDYLCRHFNVAYVDVVTEAGPNQILAMRHNDALLQSILKRVDLSIEKHSSVGIAVVGHHDCAGNPAPKSEQLQHLRDAVEYLQNIYEVPIIALWVDGDWQVNQVVNHE